MRQIFTTIVLAFLMASAAMSQDNSQNIRPVLQHEMSPDELLRKNEIGRGFVETGPPSASIRNVAEFDRMQGALVRYPFGIPISLIKEMAAGVTVTTIVATVAQQNTVISQYVANGVDTSHCNFLIAPSDSYWTRDYGPWFETDSADQVGIVDFPYNRPRPNDDDIPKKVAQMLGLPWFGMNVISTGGDYMTDGFGISASTDLVWVENPTQAHDTIAEKMSRYLGIDNYQVVPDPNISSTIDHIDCWGKFLAPDKILIRKVLTSDPEYTALESAATYWASQTCSYGYNYKVFRVMTPQDQPYSNSVILNNKVLVPFLNSSWDDSAKAVYESAMPGYQVFGFIGNPSTPWISTDALHCRVMGIADVGLLHIKHIPITGNQPVGHDYVLFAEIFASSHQPVIADSVLIHYQVNGGPYHTALMLNTAGKQYRGAIPGQPAGSVIRYYLTAADQSGRHASAPFIGAADPFVFQSVYTNLTPVPDTLWIRTIGEGRQMTQLHNYTGNAISLEAVQQFGTSLTWWVDSMSVAVLPHLLQPGDSVAVRIAMAFPVNLYPSMVYDIDSMRVTTSSGTFHVIIMVNHDLLQTIAEPAAGAKIGNNYPNPFSSATSIPVEMKQRGLVTLEILDIRGARIRTLLSQVLEPGTTTVHWDGTGPGGSRLPGGIYLYRLTSENSAETRRMVLIR
ncbi:MAG: agmatine deiminase family protein [Bacteroidetes bacterium]|nr:agmatine deiminase family protein [Bacteroidota bacterium]